MKLWNGNNLFLFMKSIWKTGGMPYLMCTLRIQLGKMLSIQKASTSFSICSESKRHLVGKFWLVFVVNRPLIDIIQISLDKLDRVSKLVFLDWFDFILYRMDLFVDWVSIVLVWFGIIIRLVSMKKISVLFLYVG